MTVADEKDKLAPQLEESRWRNRQLEKDVQRLQDTASVAEQVSYNAASLYEHKQLLCSCVSRPLYQRLCCNKHLDAALGAAHA